MKVYIEDDNGYVTEATGKLSVVFCEMEDGADSVHVVGEGSVKGVLSLIGFGISALLNTACGESERERCICEILLAAEKAKENELNIEKDSYGFARKGH